MSVAIVIKEGMGLLFGRRQEDIRNDKEKAESFSLFLFQLPLYQ